mgnify:CR=1 FL=1
MNRNVKEIEKESGHSVGFKPSGGFYLASNDVWAEYLKRERSKARYMGLDQEFISLEEVKKKNPLIDPSKYFMKHDFLKLTVVLFSNVVPTSKTMFSFVFRPCFLKRSVH